MSDAPRPAPRTPGTATLGVRGGHHVSFLVSDLERSRAFYGGILGLEEAERPDIGLPGVWYQAGAVQVHLIVPPPGFPAPPPPEKLTPLAPHFAFEIASYAEARDRLAAAGLEVFETRDEIGQLWVQDPDGHVIELIEPRPFR